MVTEIPYSGISKLIRPRYHQKYKFILNVPRLQTFVYLVHISIHKQKKIFLRENNLVEKLDCI